MIKITTLLIHSYFYLPSYLKFKNVSIQNNKIIYNNNTIIYNLNNIPENDNNYNLYHIFIDSVYNNSYNNEDCPEPFSTDLNECNNYRIVVNINNLVLQNIINSNHTIPSENIFFKLLELNNYFSKPIYDPINLKILYYEPEHFSSLNILESNLEQNNYWTNNILKNHNTMFYSLINKYSCSYVNKSNYIKINGGIISKMNNYIYFLEKLNKKTLIISDDEKHWRQFFTASPYSYEFIKSNHNNISDDNCCCFLSYQDIILNKCVHILDIYWERVLIDIKINKYRFSFSFLKDLKCRYKWFLVSENNHFINNKIIFDYLIDFKNMKYPFLKLISKKMIINLNNIFYPKKNIVLKFSKYEQERYREHSKRENDLNKIYLRKLCCYPDTFFDFDKLFSKSNTVVQYLKITNNFYNNDSKKIKFINKQVEYFDSGDYSCPICFENVIQKNFGITVCGHIFCFNCIKKSMNFTLKCPECRSHIYNNIYKIDKKNSHLKLLDYNISNLINILGTKITFIVYLLNINKNDNIIICSQYFSFLKKINLTLTHFDIPSKFINRDTVYTLDLIKDTHIFLTHSNTLINANYNFLNISKIFLGEPNLSDNLVTFISDLSIQNLPVYQLVTDNTIESDSQIKNYKENYLF